MKAFFYDEKEEELRVKCIRPYLRAAYNEYVSSAANDNPLISLPGSGEKFDADVSTRIKSSYISDVRSLELITSSRNANRVASA